MTTAPLTRYVLGCDNAMSATGLCLVLWHPVSGGKALWWTAIEPRIVNKKPDLLDYTIKLKAALHEIAREFRRYNLDLLCTEGAFAKGGRRSLAGIDVAKSGGIVIGMVRYLWSCSITIMQAAPVGAKAIGWRKVLGLSNPSDKDSSVRECGYLFHDAGGIGSNEHIWEAFGIACGGARYHFDREVTP